MVHLEEEPVAVLYHEHGRIKWSAKSQECKFTLINDVISPLSLASKTSTSKPITSGKVSSATWRTNGNENIACYEETVFFSNLNHYLTILKFENEDYT